MINIILASDDCIIIIMSKIDETEYYKAKIHFYKKIINYFFYKSL